VAIRIGADLINGGACECLVLMMMWGGRLGK